MCKYVNGINVMGLSQAYPTIDGKITVIPLEADKF